MFNWSSRKVNNKKEQIDEVYAQDYIEARKSK